MVVKKTHGNLHRWLTAALFTGCVAFIAPLNAQKLSDLEPQPADDTAPAGAEPIVTTIGDWSLVCESSDGSAQGGEPSDDSQTRLQSPIVVTLGSAPAGAVSSAGCGSRSLNF